MDSECSRLQQELQDSRDQNELLEFRILELEVSLLPGGHKILKTSHSTSQDSSWSCFGQTEDYTTSQSSQVLSLLVRQFESEPVIGAVWGSIKIILLSQQHMVGCKVHPSLGGGAHVPVFTTTQSSHHGVVCILDIKIKQIF